jgi:hypothetical protein
MNNKKLRQILYLSGRNICSQRLGALDILYYVFYKKSGWAPYIDHAGSAVDIYHTSNGRILTWRY